MFVCVCGYSLYDITPIMMMMVKVMMIMVVMSVDDSEGDEC